MNHSRISGAALAAGVLLLSACGGASPGDTAASATTQKPDTTIKQLVRQPLTVADFAGLDSTQLSMELPWTANRISRDPAPEAARASLHKVTTSSTDGFDRALFEFDETTPFPGYQILRVQAGDTLACGEDTSVLDLGAPDILLVRLIPARGGDGKRTWVRKGTRTLDLKRLTKGGLVCDDGHDLVWAAGLAEGTEARVLELKSPARLAVDVR